MKTARRFIGGIRCAQGNESVKRTAEPEDSVVRFTDSIRYPASDPSSELLGYSQSSVSLTTVRSRVEGVAVRDDLQDLRDRGLVRRASSSSDRLWPSVRQSACYKALRECGGGPPSNPPATAPVD